MLNIGQTKKLLFATHGADGLPASAATCTITIVRPNGLIEQFDVAPIGPGVYEYDLKISAPGFWSWTWRAGGAPALDWSQSDGVFVSSGQIRPSRAWCTAADAMRTPQLAKLKDAGTLDMDLLERSCVAATEWLNSRTWRRFRGLAVVELRPCCQCSWTPTSAFAWRAWELAPWRADPLPLMDGARTCACSTVPMVSLPADMPDEQLAIVGVTIDGEPFTDWRLDPGRDLVRTDGKRWPCCQDLTKPSTEPSTFAVTVVVGEALYEMARMANTELACELYLGIGDPSQCRIPTKVRTVQRQGVTYSTVETSSLAKDGMLGLRLTDIFLSEFGKRRKTMNIVSPDVPPERDRVAR